MLNKLKNYGLWTSIASLVFIILQTFGINVVPEQYENVVNSVLSLLVALGVFSNPNVGRWYLDKK